MGDCQPFAAMNLTDFIDHNGVGFPVIMKYFIYCIFIDMVDEALTINGTRASAAIVLAKLSRNILASTQVGLMRA